MGAGKLDWGDYPVITLKRYLYGMALTSRLETVRLFQLDNDVRETPSISPPSQVLASIPCHEKSPTLFRREKIQLTGLFPLDKKYLENQCPCTTESIYSHSSIQP